MFEYGMNAQVLSKPGPHVSSYYCTDITILPFDTYFLSVNKEHPLSMLEEKSKFISYVSRT